jgi:hypothetical protein
VYAYADADPPRDLLAYAGMVFEKLIHIEDKQLLLSFGLRPVESGSLIQHGYIRQPYPAFVGGPPERPEHRIVVGLPTRLAMQVVKFRDSRKPAHEHFAIGLGGDRCQAIRIHSAGQGIHTLPPSPEIVVAGWRTLFGMPREGTLKSVAVSVAETRQHDAGDKVSGFGLHFRGNARYPAVSDTEAHVFCPACV